MKKERFAKFLFEQLGTFDAPTEHKSDFLEFLTNYQAAHTKISFLKKLEFILSVDPQVSGFEFDVVSQINNKGNAYLAHYFTCVWDKNHQKSDVEDDDVLNEVKNLMYELGNEDKKLLAGKKLSLKNMSKLRKAYLSKVERENFDMVENFEKNTLEAQTPKTIKTKQKMKV